MSEMQPNETRERFNESLKRAASRCRELSVVEKKYIWNQIADSIDGLRVKGMGMASAKGLTMQQIENDIELHKKILVDRIQ